MALSHGRLNYWALDNPAGALIDLSAGLDQKDYTSSTDRPNTEVFGQDGKRYQKGGLRSAEFSVGGYVSMANPSTAKIHGRNAVVLIGAYNVSAYFDSGSISKSIDLPETQTFQDAWKERGVPGLRDDSFSLDGFHDPVASIGSYDVLRAALAAESGTALSVGYNGFAIGSFVDFGAMALESQSLPGGVNDVNRVSASGKYDGGAFLGVSLHAITAETGTVNTASVDETAATTDGGWAVLHTTAYATFTSVTIKVQHSTDDSSWADLGTFTAVTAIGGEIIEIARGTTVNRYVRSIISAVGGTGSITYTVAFWRRGYASTGTTGSLRNWNALIQNASSQTFNAGPRGSTSGFEKFSGECRLSQLTTNFSENDIEKFSATLISDGTVTEGTF